MTHSVPSTLCSAAPTATLICSSDSRSLRNSSGIWMSPSTLVTATSRSGTMLANFRMANHGMGVATAVGYPWIALYARL